MAKGDHLYYSLWINGNPFTHHGIDCGDGYVIEFLGYYQGRKVVKTPLYDFKKGRNIKVKEYGKCDLPDTVVSRAYSLLGETGYNLFTNNCEHLACFCKTGIKKSGQVKNTVTSIIGSGVKASAGIGVKIGAEATQIALEKTAQETAINSLNPIVKVLVNSGLKQAPKVTVKVAGKVGAGIAGAGGIVAGLATDYVIEKVLEDNEHLPQSERDARKTGRISGRVGSAVGAIGGSVIGAVVGGTGAIVAGALAAPVVVGGAAAFFGYKMCKKKNK